MSSAWNGSNVVDIVGVKQALSALPAFDLCGNKGKQVRRLLCPYNHHQNEIL